MPQAATKSAKPSEPISDTLIGSRLRILRRNLNLSVAELALRAGVSGGIIGQIERGIANPSLKTLMRICAALNIPLPTIFAEQGPSLELPESAAMSGFAVTEAMRAPPKIGPKGISKELLSPDGAADSLQFMTITMPPHSGSDSMTIGPGEKAGLVLEGNIVLSVDDEETKLGVGDSFLFSSENMHRLRNDSDHDARIVWIVCMSDLEVQI